MFTLIKVSRVHNLVANAAREARLVIERAVGHLTLCLVKFEQLSAFCATRPVELAWFACYSAVRIGKVLAALCRAIAMRANYNVIRRILKREITRVTILANSVAVFECNKAFAK